MPTRPNVTVIVPAYNAQATIGPCLDAINKALQPGDALIVYDDGATDDTSAIAQAAGARILRNPASPKGPGYGRNAAAEAAQTDLILFVDADVVIAPDVLDLLAGEIAKTGAIAAFGSYDDHPRSDRYTSLYANLRHHFVHQNGPEEATTFWSGIGMIDRKIFLDFGGYDTVLFVHPSIEDVELGVRLKSRAHRIRLVHNALGTHCKDWSLWRVWHTDIVRRAYPWSALIADGRTAGVDLNVSTGERITALFAIVSLGALIVTPVFPPAGLVAILSMLGYGWRNRSFFAFLAQRLPLAGLFVAIAMHWCYHLYATATFVTVMMMTRLRLRAPFHYMAPRVA